MPTINCIAKGCLERAELTDEQWRVVNDSVGPVEGDLLGYVVPIDPWHFVHFDGETVGICPEHMRGWPAPMETIPVSHGGKA